MNHQMMNDQGFAFIIPVYNHNKSVAHIIEKALQFSFPVIVIDDGSTDSTLETLKGINGITLLHFSKNQGKGAAIKLGFIAASQKADWAITIDADGQHNPDDVKNLINAIKIFCEDNSAKNEAYFYNIGKEAENQPFKRRPIVIGKRLGMEGNDVPWTSSFGKKFSNFWVKAAGGPVVADSQSGFRIYPLPEAIDLKVKTNRYQFEVEVLVKAHRKGIPVIEAPIGVDYNPGGERISHFRPFVDFMRNSFTFTRLIVNRIFVPSYFKKWLGIT